MEKNVWNTYATYCYTYDVANDQRSAGGVHLYQVRKTRVGWQKRILQSNGNYCHPGPVRPMDEQDGEVAFATAAGE